MRPVTQSRTGEHGTCFRACIASLLGLKESQVPDWPEANQDPGVNKWLAKHGLRYEESPASGTVPAGNYFALGLSPRGGQHAVIMKDGKLVMDPHPQDGTGRGLVKVSHWGLLLPAGAKDGIFTSRLDRYSMEQLLDTLGIDIKEFLRRTVDQRERLIDTAIRELDKKTGGAKDMDLRDGVTKCQACGVGLMGDDVLERGGKVICPECADVAVRRKAKDTTLMNATPEQLRKRLAYLKAGGGPNTSNAVAQIKVIEKLLAGNSKPAIDRSRAKDTTLMNATPEQLRKRLAYLKAGGGPNTSNAVAQIKVIEKLLAGNSKPAIDRSRAKDTSYAEARKKYVDGPNGDGEFSAGVSGLGGTAQRGGFKTRKEAEAWIAKMLLKVSHKPALDRARLHRALDAVMDSRGALARDADFCECESSRCSHSGACPRSEGLKRYNVGGYRQTLCPYCARQAEKYCKSSKLPFDVVGTL